MASVRLTGKALAAAVVAAKTPGTHAIVREVMRKGYRLDALLHLPAGVRLPMDLDVKPLQAGAPRSWGGDSALTPPTASAERATVESFERAYQSRATTPTEVLHKIRSAAEAGVYGESVHSPFSDTDWETAEEAAEASTARWQKGRPKSGLDGVPLPVKDEHNMEGLPTRGGTAYRVLPEPQDSFVVKTLRAAGALLYAKTHTTEWGMSPIGMSAHTPLPRNPYHRDHAAGGSSTGSAVAVALGYAPVAVGSDGGGSIRIPAALCGLYGIKPTYGHVGRSGNIFGSGSVAVGGPIGQSTADLVALLEVVALAKDPEDVHVHRLPKTKGRAASWYDALCRGVRGCRIGVPRELWREASPEVAALCEGALSALEREGAQLVPLEIPLASFANAIGVLSIGPETMALLEEDFEAHEALFGQDLQLTLHVLRHLSAREMLLAQRARATLRRTTAAALQSVDVIALPTTATTAPRYPLAETGVAVSDDEATRAMCTFNFLANLTGLPAGSAPVGMSQGLPVGLQFVGDAWDEASVLAMLAHTERLGMGALPAPRNALTWEAGT